MPAPRRARPTCSYEVGGREEPVLEVVDAELGPRHLGRDGRIGTIAPGKQADLMVVTGDPSRAIGDARKVETVFRQGVGFDSQRLIQSVSGRVGLW